MFVGRVRRETSDMNLRVRERHDVDESLLDYEPRWIAPLMRPQIEPTTQACCCPAPAVYAVVIAPTEKLPHPPEILLCAHHLRAARERLENADAGIYDASGRLVE